MTNCICKVVALSSAMFSCLVMTGAHAAKAPAHSAMLVRIEFYENGQLITARELPMSTRNPASLDINWNTMQPKACADGRKGLTPVNNGLQITVSKVAGSGTSFDVEAGSSRHPQYTMPRLENCPPLDRTGYTQTIRRRILTTPGNRLMLEMPFDRQIAVTAL